ncbi:MAG: alpha-L-fucosidase [Cyclobacteriaceae bacterium]
MINKFGLIIGFAILLAACTTPQETNENKTSSMVERVTYQPTNESISQHPLPEWYQDAKLGIFIHWGLYSVPGWAQGTKTLLEEILANTAREEWFANNPYAEWYLNSLRIEGSAPAA